MEWCINESGEAYFVQARPITRKIIIREKLSTGAIASPGYCSGIIYTIDEDIDDDEIIEQKSKIFLLVPYYSLKQQILIMYQQ